MPGRLLASRVGSRFYFFVIAAATGAVVGFATLGLIELIRLVQFAGYGDGSQVRVAGAVANLPPWRIVLVPALGGLVVGGLLQLLPDRRYHGIADVMEACALKGARMTARSGAAAALAAGISLGVGAPLGREGPAVHIGASIGAWLAERLGLDHRQSLALLGCGAAAAVAVSFNAPVAAVILALEVVVGYFTLRVFAPIVIAAMAAMVVRLGAIGTEPLFPVPAYAIETLWELVPFALLGVIGAALAKLLIAGVELTRAGWEAAGVPRWLRPGCAGLVIGLIALELPLILGIGFEATFAALRGELPAPLLGALLVVKLFAVVLALGAGFAGGVFGPAIYLGAMLGGACWWLVSLAGAPLAEQGVYAVIGMAAVASALLGAPISTILIVFELTRDYEVTLGVMTAAAVASTTMQVGRHGSYFRWQLASRGVDIGGGRDLSLLARENCEPLVSTRHLSVDPAITIGELESRMGTERLRVALFFDGEGRFAGSTDLAGLIGHAIANGLNSPAGDAAIDPDYSIDASASIVAAVKRMAERDLEFLPVVRADDADAPALALGIVFKSDLLSAHYDVLRRAREDEFGIT